MVAVTNRKDSLVFLVLALYFFIAVFGNLFNLGSSETAIRLSTLLLLVIIALKVDVVVRTILRNKIFLMLLFLLSWCMFTGLFADETMIVQAYINTAVLFGYLFAAISVYKTRITEERINALIYLLGASISIASILTIIDFLKIYDIPYVNETSAATQIGSDYIEQASGFFPLRSAMAAYYSVIIPTLLYYAFRSSNARVKMFMLFSSGVSLLALFLTHNRSGMLSIVMALLLFVLLDKSTKIGKKASLLVLVSTMFGVFIYIAYIFFPEVLDVYVMKLNRFLPGEGFDAGAKASRAVVESDYTRVYYFTEVMKSLLSNPIGNGFAHIYTEKFGYVSPHNLITHIIWAAGVMAFIWMPLFLYHIVTQFNISAFRKNNLINQNILAATAALQVGLLAWFLNNMAHNTINTGLAWLYLGLVLNMKRVLDAGDQPSPVGKESADMKSGRKYPHLLS